MHRATVFQTDSVMHLETFFVMPQDAKWRNQKVRLTLRVPVGQKIHFNESMMNLLYNYEVYDDSWDEDMVGETLVMGTKGLVYSQQAETDSTTVSNQQ